MRHGCDNLFSSIKLDSSNVCSETLDELLGSTTWQITWADMLVT